ncbi:MAG: anthranilate phosphoribosyltransferase [Chloroflexi bacterium]|nr:anthranilate phosphoribosyltransferase [Chloroflexota bacterium]
MGIFRYRIEIAGSAAGPVEALEAIVDSGAAYTQAPRSLLERLGIPPVDRATFVLANGQTVDCDVGEATIRIGYLLSQTQAGAIREAIDAIVSEGRDLSEEEAAAVMAEVMTGEATPAQLGAFLIALRLKGETVDEITGMARVMREKALRIDAGEGLVLDTCGTGGDASGSFNVSTAAAFVAAAAGVRVAKHGNRAMTSRCGSADVLEALGARIDLSPEQVARCIQEVGVGFMFAPNFHPAMKFAAGPRREIGVRTVFNILGPLTNPAGARAQLLGVADPALAEKLGQVLQRLGSAHALVVHGREGLDELSIGGPSLVCELRNGSVRSYEVAPEDAGLARAPLESVRGGAPEENAAALRRVLGGGPGPLRDFVILNAAAGLVAADAAPDLRRGAALAAEAIDSGRAQARLDAFVEATRSFS